MNIPNALDQVAEPFMRRIENLFDDLETLRGEYMASCKTVRADIKEVYGEAKDQGVPARALKGLVKYRHLERKQLAIVDGLDEEAADYELLVETLGDLGMAAARAAGHPAGDGLDAR